jgi:hypothetical protein
MQGLQAVTAQVRNGIDWLIAVRGGVPNTDGFALSQSRRCLAALSAA